RTRNRAPHTNGVIERFFRSIKYERLYRRDIGDGIELAAQADAYRTVFNHVRPHEALAMTRPADRYRQPPEPENDSDT
ncbi:MAG: integrase core domain-containing protein, partial [Acidimicrobiaceae bacterium]|nr:integrase core domain-containing protein [Acidimicrobiaceae bacterium]